MKKMLFTLFLMVLGTCAFAQKSYVTVYAPIDNWNVFVRLSGNIPSSMMDTYRASDFSLSYETRVYSWIGNVLNLLANEGFVVEQMNTVFDGTFLYSTYLLSKGGTSTNPSNAIKRVQADPDEEVTEVARYNLQGMPIGKNEKGIQIVVYSNYTTKTIIVE